MKKKDLKKVAEKIARAEQTIAQNIDQKQVEDAKNEILRLARSVGTLEEMMLLDDLIQEILKKS
jgi:protein-arginine kinase